MQMLSQERECKLQLALSSLMRRRLPKEEAELSRQCPPAHRTSLMVLRPLLCQPMGVPKVLDPELEQNSYKEVQVSYVFCAAQGACGLWQEMRTSGASCGYQGGQRSRWRPAQMQR